MASRARLLRSAWTTSLVVVSAQWIIRDDRGSSPRLAGLADSPQPAKASPPRGVAPWLLVDGRVLEEIGSGDMPMGATAEWVLQVLRVVATATGKAILISSALFAFIYLFERRSGADLRRYLTRNFLHDLGYSFFYRSFYSPVLYAFAFAALSPQLAVFDLKLLSSLPGPVAFAAFWVFCDFGQYWVHRLQHTRFFWPLHSMHHSQTVLTFPAAYRNHPLEQALANLIMLIPIMVLGVPASRFLPVYLAQEFLDGIQHSGLGWRFGRLYPVLVSPGFHLMHHSTRPEHHNRNFGKIFSVWDRLFGTAIDSDLGSLVYGVEGRPMRSVRSQLVEPCRELLRTLFGSNTGAASRNEAAPYVRGGWT